MVGYVASFTPLAKGSYRFELELILLNGGRIQQRRVADHVVDDVALADVELTFLGSLVQKLQQGSQLRSQL